MKKENRFYILRIWHTGALYKGKQVYVAGANAITGKRWGIIPVFIKDLDHARDLTAKEIQTNLHTKIEKSIHVNEPFIKENLLGCSYFSNGKANVLLIEDNAI